MLKSIPRSVRWYGILFSSLSVCLGLRLQVYGANSESNSETPPNVVVIFIDDMGYADIGPFGESEIPTPNLNRLAEEGCRFTDFIVSSAVCSASRAALMTGCLHYRVGFTGAINHQATHGLHEDEMTLAEVAKQRGYATACYGKWHLGHHPRFLPTSHGFDHYVGLPYSNDMWPVPYGQHVAVQGETKKNYPPLPLIENEAILDAEVSAKDQEQLTTIYTENAVQFIRENAKQPFLVYVPHSMVHVPLYVSDKFRGKSSRGIFGDVVMEIDWSVGQIMNVLEELDIAENTLVVFSTDNGPWLNFGTHAGSATPLREGKGTSWEGGIRVPTIMRWPGRIEAGSECKSLASTIDLVPTLADILQVELPNHPIDGKSLLPLFKDPENADCQHESIPIYYANGQLQALRTDQYKMVFPHRYRSLNGIEGTTNDDGTPIKYNSLMSELELYDLDRDVSEQENLIQELPEVANQLQQLASVWRDKLGDRLQKIEGTEVRQPGRLTEEDERLTW